MSFASERLWGIPWSTLLPLQLTSGGGELVAISYEEASTFVAANFKDIYDDPESPFRWLAPHPARVRYYELFGDLFGFRLDGKLVGVGSCAPSDWATYYIRNVSFLPDGEGKGLSQFFLRRLGEILQVHGVERLELETSPSNFGVIQTVTRQGFNITGQANSDRWGSILRFTRFLEPDAERVFLDRFCCGRKPQLKRPSATAAVTNNRITEEAL